MQAPGSLRAVIHNSLQYGDLTFRDFMELALYHPQLGYYSTSRNPVGKEGDYVTATTLGPAFSFAIAKLLAELVSRCEGGVSSFVDVGCGGGELVRAVAHQIDDPTVRFFGVDRSLERAEAASDGGMIRFVRTIDELLRDELPRNGCQLAFSSELFDALPFARLVRRGEHLHELWVTEREGSLDWSEHEAPAVYEDYFAERGIELAEGQFADISPEWGAFYEDVARFVERGLIVTVDYGYRQEKLFHPRIRRFGTAAAYSGQRVTRDLLADPGEQDLTAHVNFTDLQRAGEGVGARTLFFDSLAKFVLSVGIAEHELFRPLDELAVQLAGSDAEEGLRLLEARDEARRLVLPDGIGEDLRVLVQARGIGLEEWSFQRKLF